MSVCNKKVIPYPLRAFGGSMPGVVKKNLVMKNTGKLFIWPFVQLVIIVFAKRTSGICHYNVIHKYPNRAIILNFGK